MPLLEDLPRVEDTVWGRELKEIWQIESEIKSIQSHLHQCEQLLANEQMSQELYDQITAPLQKRLS